MTAQQRFRDPGVTKYRLAIQVLVSCPRCGGAAQVGPAPDRPAPQVSAGGRLFATRRLVCHGCGLNRGKAFGVAGFPVGTRHPVTDPYFGLPLRLQTWTRHGWLWAYNLEHLALLRDFVRAERRERPAPAGRCRNSTVVSRLPRWIKLAKNRDEVLRAVDRLSALAVDG